MIAWREGRAGDTVGGGALLRGGEGVVAVGAGAGVAEESWSTDGAADVAVLEVRRCVVKLIVS